MKIYLAPFQGITGVTFRQVYTKHFGGIDKLYTPFLTNINRDSGLPDRKRAELGNTHENGVEVVPQILSRDADEIRRFARHCRDLGFSEINWNLGCPYPQVANKKRGSGLMPYPEMVSSILTEVMAEAPLSVSVKCRLGYASPDEIFALIPVFNTCRISELTVHARIGRQLYSGETDPQTLERLLPLLEIPFVYNGDIFAPEDLKRIEQHFPNLHTWMIGRGILRDPFLPALLKGESLPEQPERVIRRFAEDLYLRYLKQLNGSLAVTGIMKEYWSYLSASFDDPHGILRRLRKANGFDAYESAVASVFSDHAWFGCLKPHIPGE
jgi:tRNA-dihydrouridine synthase B